MTEQLVIGMVGGMSWLSTAEYYRLANILTASKRGPRVSARIILNSIDFDQLDQFQSIGQWDLAANLVVDAARSVERAGADMLLICTNTMHIAAKEVEEAVSIPLVHIADSVSKIVELRGFSKVGLLGTQATLRANFYGARLAALGVEVLVPSNDDQVAIGRLIREELCAGVFAPSSRIALLAVVKRLASAGAQGVILACTELELLLPPEECDVPLIASARAHVELAVHLSLRE